MSFPKAYPTMASIRLAVFPEAMMAWEASSDMSRHLVAKLDENGSDALPAFRKDTLPALLC